MTVRVITGLLGGLALIVLLLYDFRTALFSVALLHAMALYEFARLDPRWRSSSMPVFVSLAGFIIAATFVLTLTTQALVKLRPGELPLVLLVLTAMLLLIGDLRAYERGGKSGAYRHLLFALLLVTLPFCFVAPVATWPGGFPYLLLLLGASFGADVGSMLCGVLVGRHKLARRLSPKKTVEGLIGGLLAAAACWMVTGAVWPLSFSAGPFDFGALDPVLQLMVLGLAGMVVALVGIVGGLVFSMYKREAGIKDYGALLPGHGGIIDRFDAFMFCAPLVYLICLG